MELVAVIALLQMLLLPLHLEEKHALEHCHIQQQHLELVLPTHVEAFEATHSNHPFGMTLTASPSVVLHYKFCYIIHNATITSILLSAIILYSK